VVKWWQFIYFILNQDVWVCEKLKIKNVHITIFPLKIKKSKTDAKAQLTFLLKSLITS